MTFSILGFLLLAQIASAAKIEYVSAPSTDLWYNATRVIADPSVVTNYTLVTRESWSSFTINGTLCTLVFNLTSSETICRVGVVDSGNE